MKKTLLIFCSALALQAMSQPVIQDSANLPHSGFNVPVLTAPASGGAGGAGANQTWDFSNLSFSNAGTYSVILPSASPIGGSFPTANYAYSFMSTYSFFSANASKMDVLAYTITSAGSGNDYSANPRTVLKFPFNYLDTLTDSWQKVGGSVNTVKLTYDGYGTLKAPGVTYQNVVRIREEFGNGSDYQWYTLNPLMSVMIFDHNTNTLYHTNAVQLRLAETALPESKGLIYPNPGKGLFTFNTAQLPANSPYRLNICNSLGQSVYQITELAAVSTVDLSTLPAGMYFYQLSSNAGSIQSGELIIE